MSKEIKPITLKKGNNTMPLILNNKIKLLPFKGNVKFVKSLGFQEDVIYTSKCGRFLPGGIQELTIVNRCDLRTKSCHTIAICKSATVVYEKTSANITKLIGQCNYDTLFTSLCSIINQDLKIRAIYALLTVPKSSKPVACQTEELKSNWSDEILIHEIKSLDEGGSVTEQPAIKKTVQSSDMHCQTDESYIAFCNTSKMKNRRRAKRAQLAPYVVQEEPLPKHPRRLVISPKNFETVLKSTDIKQEDASKEELLPDLSGSVFSDDSNHSKVSLSSFVTMPELLMDPMSLLNKEIDKVTRNPNGVKEDYILHNLDSLNGSNRLDPLSQAIKLLPTEQRVKILLQQGLNDIKNCLLADESGHLPIHVAVITNNVDMLKRQCLVLKMRNVSVDIPADNLSPLRMSLYQEDAQMTAVLLQHNADALDSDDHDHTCFHIAAEKASDHLQALVQHCQHNARKILADNDDLWKPDFADKTDKELSDILLNHINKLYDDQGYTPLMVASKHGRYENVKLLVESCPNIINARMPSSGNTALFLAVASACMDATERGNKSKVVDHFRKTIEILVENGADPTLGNFTGANVNDLLTEYNIGDLSMLIANKLTSRNFHDGKLPPGTNKFDAFMLIKDEDGNVDIKKMDKTKKPKPPPKTKSSRVTKKTAVDQKLTYTKEKKAIIIKSETITGQTLPGNSNNINVRKNMARVQNFQMNKPLILKSVPSNNRRKIEISIEPSTNSND